MNESISYASAEHHKVLDVRSLYIELKTKTENIIIH